MRRHRERRADAPAQNCARCSVLSRRCAEKAVHLGAQIAQSHAGIARRAPAHEFADAVIEAGIVVVQPLESDQGAQQCSGLAGFDAGREQEQQ